MAHTMLISDPSCLKHLTGYGHPESPFRYQAIDHLLLSRGFNSRIKPRPAAKEELLLCHTESYLHLVEHNMQQCTQSRIVDGSYLLSTGDVQICPDSLQAALLSAGAALTGVDLVMEKKAKNVFSYLRPPGHHACTNKGMGFCIFNSAAVAARYVQKKYGLKHVLIVDWDVHHGNGTQEIFDADPTVFYFSTHQKGLYPGTGSIEEQGIGSAKGTKLNFPIEPGPSSRHEVLAAFRKPLAEAMQKFQPEFVIISAGFDAHYLDPLGGFNLTEQDFAELTSIVMQVAKQHAEERVVSLLEGGYHLEGLANSALAHVETLHS